MPRATFCEQSSVLHCRSSSSSSSSQVNAGAVRKTINQIMHCCNSEYLHFHTERPQVHGHGSACCWIFAKRCKTNPPKINTVYKFMYDCVQFIYGECNSQVVFRQFIFSFCHCSLLRKRFSSEKLTKRFVFFAFVWELCFTQRFTCYKL